MKKNVLVCYISRYSGHYHAAEAVEKGLIEAFPGLVRVEKVNVMEYTNPVLGKVINRAYIEIIKKRPAIWGNIYDNPEFMKKTQKTRESLHKFNMSKIKKLMEKYSPDTVFCTQAFPCGMVADYKRTCRKDLSLVGILTDHAPHSYWIFDEVDKYVVPSEKTRDVFIAKGVPPGKIDVLGIPVSPHFERKLDAKKIREDLGISPEARVVLVMGGSQGLGCVENVVRSFMDDRESDYTLLVVTGKNRTLLFKLRRLLKSRKDRRIRVYGYVDNIDELMEAADVIVTKAGGMTTSEALAKRLPMVIVNPIPGHEKMNTDFLVSSGAAVEAPDFSFVHDAVKSIFDPSEGTEDMVRSIERIVKPNSAANIAKLVFEE